LKDGVLLTVEDLHIAFATFEGTVHALNGVNFQIQRSEIFGLAGETGSGKTVTALTILKLLPSNTGMLKGRVIFNGRDLLAEDEEGLKEVRGKKISMIFQDPAASLNPVFSVSEQLGDVLRSHGTIDRIRQEKSQELLRAVGFSDTEKILQGYPHELSGGMKQRVATAIAIASEPELIIADEPTTSLDVVTQLQILNLLKTIRSRRGSSILLITHNLGILARHSDRVGIMYAGNIAEIAPTSLIFRNPLHPYTKALLSAVPRERGKSLHTIAGEVPNLLEAPQGCSFHTRCERASEICRSLKPQLTEPERGRLVACHLYATRSEDYV